MDKNLQEFNRLFREKIESLDSSIDQEVWENIEKQLDKDEIRLYKKKYKLLMRASLCLLFVFSALAIFTFRRHLNSPNVSPASLSKPIANNKDKEFKSNVVIDKYNQLNKNRIPLTVESPLPNSKNIKELTRNGSRFSDRRLSDRLVTGKNELQNSKTSYSNTSFINLQIEKKQNPIRSSILGSSLSSCVYKERNSKQEKEVEANNLNAPISSTYITSGTRCIPPLEGINPNADTIKWTANIGDKKSITKTTQNSRFSIGPYFALEQAGYRLNDDKGNQYDNKEKIEGREKNEFSYSTGMIVGFRLDKNWSIESGISFSSSDIFISQSKVFAETNNSGDIKFRYNTSSGYSYFLPTFNTSPLVGDSLSTKTSSFRVQYLGIPTSLRYAFEKGKFSFGMGAGVILNFLTSSVVETEVESFQDKEKETITKLEGLKKINLNVILSPELKYKLSDKWSLQARPYYKFSLGATDKGNIVKTYSFNTALSAGIIYQL